MFKSRQRDPGSGPSGPAFHTALIGALLGFGMFFDHTAATTPLRGEAQAAPQADPARPSADVRRLAQWAVDTGDHNGRPFVVVDKERAQLFTFDASGRLRASAPVLLGALRGDAPEVPATPAGRFAAESGHSPPGDAIEWAHGEVVLSLHAHPSPTSPGRAAQRLASDRIEDKRISDGSLHVAGDFYRQFLAPLRNRPSVAYVLPEVQLAHDVFMRPNGDPARVAQSPGARNSRRPS